MSISASQWGSPLASRRALLIHGLTMSSSSWEGLAQQLAAEGFFVIAPNLPGHAWRRGSDYRVSALAEDLRPYFAMNTSYDVIIGHSLGAAVTLSLLPFLPTTTETTVILVDPPLETSDEQLDAIENLFLKEMASAKTNDEYMEEYPRWSRRDSTLRAQGLTMCTGAVVKEILGRSRPWSFSGLLRNIPSNVKMTVLIADSDPILSGVCNQEDIPRDIDINTRVITGVGHWIQFERPDAIMDVVPQARASALIMGPVV